MGLSSGSGSTTCRTRSVAEIVKTRVHQNLETNRFTNKYASFPISLVDMIVIDLKTREENFVLLLRYCSLHNPPDEYKYDGKSGRAKSTYPKRGVRLSCGLSLAHDKGPKYSVIQIVDVCWLSACQRKKCEDQSTNCLPVSKRSNHELHVHWDKALSAHRKKEDIEEVYLENTSTSGKRRKM